MSPPADADTDTDPNAQSAEFERVADELYALKPEDFSAARDAAIKQARADRKPGLARALAKLRKPTQSAWLVNLLWRDQREVMQQLFELAQELGRAQAEAAAPELRELIAQRRQLEAALTHQAVALAQKAGVRVSDAVMRETQDTLGAAMARPDVADEVRTGRLVKPAAYAGFGLVAPGSPQAAVAPRSPQTAARQAPAGPREPIDLQAAQRARRASSAKAASGAAAAEAAASEAEAQTAAAEAEAQAAAAEAEAGQAEAQAAAAEAEAAAEAQRRAEAEARAAAQRLVQHARQALERAQAGLVDKTRQLEAAVKRRDDLRQQLEALRQQLQRVEAQAEAAERDAGAAADARDQAEHASAEAREALQRAESELEAASR